MTLGDHQSYIMLPVSEVLDTCTPSPTELIQRKPEVHTAHATVWQAWVATHSRHSLCPTPTTHMSHCRCATGLSDCLPYHHHHHYTACAAKAMVLQRDQTYLPHPPASTRINRTGTAMSTPACNNCMFHSTWTLGWTHLHALHLSSSLTPTQESTNARVGRPDTTRRGATQLQVALQCSTTAHHQNSALTITKAKQSSPGQLPAW
jgi:hypothetical protein